MKESTSFIGSIFEDSRVRPLYGGNVHIAHLYVVVVVVALIMSALSLVERDRQRPTPGHGCGRRAA